jgi:cellulose synthase/poly-beta-1,6-N-acetylglucosamine synthase-like glycosyltransferase
MNNLSFKNNLKLERILISVVIAAFNGEKFILELLESIASQTHQVDEIVVCDDCSTDNTIKILDNDKFTGVLAVVDADFDRLENNLPESPNILLTDDHDLEVMILKTPALEKVIKERGSEEKTKDNNIREILLKIGQEIGYLRWVSQKYNLSLRFENLDLGRFIKKDTLSIDCSELIKAIKNHSQKPLLVDNDILEKMRELRNNEHDPWQVCCGHDIMEILSLALCRAWGTCKPTDVKAENLERDLRLAYERSYFYQTQLYCLIQNWQNANFPYQVLNAIASK